MKKKIIIIGAVVGVVLIGVVAFLLLQKKTFNVEFDSNGGTAIETQIVKEGEKATKPSDPKKEGFIFVSWELDGFQYDFDKPVTKDIMLKATYKEIIKTFKVTIVVDGEKKELNVSKLTKAEIEKVFPAREGYEFKLYSNGNEYDINTALTSDIELTGTYVKLESYTVKFDSNGGSTVAKQEVLGGKKAVEPEDPTKEYYVFDGWYLDNVKYDFNTEVTKNITLKAKWSEDPNVKRYNVTFNTDGGSIVAKQRIIENKTVSMPKNPTKKGYEFVEWQLDGVKFDPKTKITKDITLKAIWKEIITYTVTFNSDGGSNVPNQTIVEGKKATKPSNPTKKGYKFKAWTLNGQSFDFNTLITENITLVATWEEIVNYTITINKVDTYSPDRILKVYKNGTETSFKQISTMDGTKIAGANGASNVDEIGNNTSFKVTLSNNTVVVATLTS
jgi:uncharacterized repeat protein (TIGR02543 family)